MIISTFKSEQYILLFKYIFFFISSQIEVYIYLSCFIRSKYLHAMNKFLIINYTFLNCNKICQLAKTYLHYGVDVINEIRWLKDFILHQTKTKYML